MAYDSDSQSVVLGSPIDNTRLCGEGTPSFGASWLKFKNELSDPCRTSRVTGRRSVSAIYLFYRYYHD